MTNVSQRDDTTSQTVFYTMRAHSQAQVKEERISKYGTAGDATDPWWLHVSQLDIYGVYLSVLGVLIKR